MGLICEILLCKITIVSCLANTVSQGLEFDAVLICDADNQNYYDDDDKNLLYVACTRALHRLSLFCEKEVSPLLYATSKHTKPEQTE